MLISLARSIETNPPVNESLIVKIGEIWVNKLSPSEARSIPFNLLQKNLINVRTFNILDKLKTKFEVAEKFELVTGQVSDMAVYCQKTRLKGVSYDEITTEVMSLGYGPISIEILFSLMTNYCHLMTRPGHLITMVKIQDLLHLNLQHLLTLNIDKYSGVKMNSHLDMSHSKFSASSNFLFAKQVA